MWCRNSIFESWFASSSLVESGIKNFFSTRALWRHAKCIFKTRKTAILLLLDCAVVWKLAGVIWIAQEKLSNLSGKRASQATLTFVQYILHVMEASPFGWILKELGLTMQCTKWSPVWLMLAIWLSAQLQVWFCKYLLTSLSQGGTSDILSWINSTWPKLLPKVL